MDNTADDRAHVNEHVMKSTYTWHIQFSDNTKRSMPTLCSQESDSSDLTR
jgi:hypothetical protein